VVASLNQLYTGRLPSITLTSVVGPLSKGQHEAMSLLFRACVNFCSIQEKIINPCWKDFFSKFRVSYSGEIVDTGIWALTRYSYHQASKPHMSCVVLSLEWDGVTLWASHSTFTAA
jgi:hypothetical protein